MLNENIKTLRKAKGLSQEELAIRLNVVRQTISKWERGLSVPDSEMLISIAEVLDTNVSTLLGESIVETKTEDLKVICEKLEVINLQLAQRKRMKRNVVLGLMIIVCILILLLFALFLTLDSPYLSWDYNNPEKAVVGVILHGIEWLFIRLAPVVFVGGLFGIAMMYKKR